MFAQKLITVMLMLSLPVAQKSHFLRRNWTPFARSYSDKPLPQCGEDGPLAGVRQDLGALCAPVHAGRISACFCSAEGVRPSPGISLTHASFLPALSPEVACLLPREPRLSC